MAACFKYKTATDHAGHDYKVHEGEVIKITSWALYDIQNEEMKKILCNLFAEGLLRRVVVKTYIKDDESSADLDLQLYNLF